MDTKVNYAGITRRVVAYIVDAVISLLLYALFYLLILFILSGESLSDFFSGVFSGTDSVFMSVQCQALETLLFVVLETLMITKFGWTPGKLLCGIRVKDANTLENVSLMQAVIRSTLKALLLLPGYISEWFLILPILALIPAIFDQHKQLFYDKIAKTVVMDCEPEECHANVNYVGITRRVIACVIDYIIMSGILPILYFVLASVLAGVFTSNELGNSNISVAFGFLRSNTLLVILIFCIFFIILETLMITRFSGTPGQLLCGIHIKDASALKNVTIMQVITRCVFRDVVIDIIFLGIKHISGWFAIPLVLILIFAIFDKRKQFFYDKIARTVAIDCKSSNIKFT